MSQRSFPDSYITKLKCFEVCPDGQVDPVGSSAFQAVCYRYRDPSRYLWYTGRPLYLMPRPTTEALWAYDLPTIVTGVDVFVSIAVMPEGAPPISLPGFEVEAYAGIGASTSQVFAQVFNPLAGDVTGGTNSPHGRLFSFGGAGLTRIELYGRSRNNTTTGVPAARINLELMFIAHTSGPTPPFSNLGDFSPP